MNNCFRSVVTVIPLHIRAAADNYYYIYTYTRYIINIYTRRNSGEYYRAPELTEIVIRTYRRKNEPKAVCARVYVCFKRLGV